MHLPQVACDAFGGDRDGCRVLTDATASRVRTTIEMDVVANESL